MKFILGTKELKEKNEIQPNQTPYILTDIIPVKTTADANDYITTHHKLKYKIYERPLKTPPDDYYILGEYQKNYARIYLKLTLKEAQKLMQEKINEIVIALLATQEEMNIKTNININIRDTNALIYTPQIPQTTTSYLIIKGERL